MKQLIVFSAIFVLLGLAQIWWLLAHRWKMKKLKEFKILNSDNMFDENPRFRFISNFGRRLQVAWILFFIMVLGFSLGTVGLTLLFIFISFIALREFVSVMHLKPGDYWPIFFSFYVFLPAQYFFVMTDLQFLFYIFIPVYVFLFSPMLAAMASDTDKFFERASKFQWAQIACIYCLSYGPALGNLQLRNGTFESSSLLLFLLVVVAASHSFQYLIGTKFGKKMVFEKMSNATWEGTIAGVVAGAVFGLAAFMLTPFAWWQAMIMGAVISMVGFCGELVMSGIKKSMRITHWSEALGAQGGVLDRFDGFIFSAPLFYHLCKYFFA